MTTLRERFAYHPPTSDAVREAHEAVRAACLRAGEELQRLVPRCRELELAFEALDLACMHANAAVARTQLAGHVERHPDDFPDDQSAG